MGWEWLASLQSIVELLGSLIPRRIKIPPTHRGIRLRGMTKVTVLQPGLYWYWPFRSEVLVKLVAARNLSLVSQYVMTRDGKTIWVDGSVIHSIYPDDASIIRAFLETDGIEEVAAAVAMAALNELIEDTLFEELFDRQTFNRNFRQILRKKFKTYGLRVHSGNIETLASGRPILVLGNGR